MAGAAGDLRISGTSSYDTNNAALQAIRNEWDTVSSHAAAFNVLHSSAGIGPSHWRLTWDTKVKHDSTAEIRTGSNAVDWFFAGIGETTAGKQIGLNYLNNGLA